MVIKDNSVVLFQGDSVTDAGRDRDDINSFGQGYPLMAASMFAANHPTMNVTFINKGVSGDRTTELMARWQEDCIDLKPDVVSILIGINDCWRRFDNNNPMWEDDFHYNYKSLLTQVKEKLNAKIILMEPFLLPYPEDRKQWRVDLDPKIHKVRELAKEFNAIYIPLDGIFAQMSVGKEDGFWSADGVHPSDAGHALIAKNWLKAVEEF